MPDITRVLLADNHQLIHKFIIQLFQEVPEVELIATVIDGNEAQRLCLEQQPDVLLLAANVAGPTILDNLNFISHHCPKTRTLTFLADYDEMSVRILLDNGATGCFLKSDTPENLVTAVSLVSGDEVYLSQPLLKKYIYERTEEVTVSKLTERERAILQYVAAEMSDNEIAAKLNLGERTVRNHLELLRDKLNVKTRVGLAVQATKLKLIK